MAGRLVSMSLEGIRQLDAFYGNTASHTRQLVPIRKSRSENGDVVMAWCYFTNISTISKYDPHDKVYKLASGITPKRIPTLDIYGGKGEKVFELTRTVIG